jgi:hypothetical protein
MAFKMNLIITSFLIYLNFTQCMPQNRDAFQFAMNKGAPPLNNPSPADSQDSSAGANNKSAAPAQDVVLLQTKNTNRNYQSPPIETYSDLFNSGYVENGMYE